MPSCLDGLFSDKSLKPLELNRVRRTGKPNDYLLADSAVVTCDVNGDAVSLPPGTTAEDVRSAVKSYAVDELGGVEREAGDDKGLYVIRTKMMRYPDGLYYWIEEEADGGGGLKVSLYGRAVFGHGDMGVNKGRVTALKRKLEER
eukprot:CAMPEP_0183291694 /NCGR_PEP_ID=MMETSP0160_2-20130417/1021_1 /TAXON_ID=2839 ORGANISM="Odontella Sinensis, Strain Grunow 1884" /NCGR_SAMPLE_ID=MMETSP0160_2 /ASSEMBLY_ACC=CAM_ASM_000250 /LENGTH=144 /DNA_ID=CAMNT_0025452529 /DNA_START=103 /DNA_END=537 /DNA_ORIENTATION=-